MIRSLKTEFDIMVGRRIQEVMDILRLDPVTSPLVPSLTSINWDRIMSSLDELDPVQIFQLGKLSGLLRVGRDVYSLGRSPIILTKNGEIIQNIQKLSVLVVPSVEEGRLLIQDLPNEERL